MNAFQPAAFSRFGDVAVRDRSQGFDVVNRDSIDRALAEQRTADDGGGGAGQHGRARAARRRCSMSSRAAITRSTPSGRPPGRSVPEPEEAVPFVLETVRLVRDQLEPEQALVGFCGGPFTVAGYLVEGRPSSLPRTSSFSQ